MFANESGVSRLECNLLQAQFLLKVLLKFFSRKVGLSIDYFIASRFVRCKLCGAVVLLVHVIWCNACLALCSGLRAQCKPCRQSTLPKALLSRFLILPILTELGSSQLHNRLLRGIWRRHLIIPMGDVVFQEQVSIADEYGCAYQIQLWV